MPGQPVSLGPGGIRVGDVILVLEAAGAADPKASRHELHQVED